MKKFPSLILLCVLSFAGFAQKYSIKGQVTDSTAAPLPSSTIMLLNPKDSSLVNFGISDTKGFFEIKNVAKGTYQLKITYTGYAPYVKKFTTSESDAEVQLGQLRMLPITKELAELVVRGERAPVTVKRDTIEFNAGSFKVSTNASVEDLLKKLPGIEVESDGTVKAQGEQVQRVTVDGREFFGRDPKLATRNLPADAIDKVQVFDKKSDQAVFTGIDDGQTEKTINLELKEEKRNGAFGNIMGGAGTEERFQAKASINRFSKGKQLSFLGMANNTNEQGFSIGEFMNFTGGSQQMMGASGGGRVTIQIGGDNSSSVPLSTGGRQNGILTNYAGGVNFNRDLSKNTILNSSYFYSNLNQDIAKSVDRINYLPQGSYNFNQNTKQLSQGDNHKVNLTLDHKLDSANSLKFTANATYSESEQNAITKSKTMTPDNMLRNESVSRTYNAQDNLSLSSNLLFRHRFAKKGRSLSANLTLGLGQTDSEGNLQSDNQYYDNAEEQQEIRQTNTQSTQTQSYGANVTYIEPLGGRKYLEASYNFRTNRNEVDREVYDIENGLPVTNIKLSNLYSSNYIYSRPGINFRMNRQKYSLTMGAGYQQTQLKGDLVQQDITQSIDRTFQNVLPSIRFNYDFSNFKHIRFDYETAIQEPSITQLQPVVDNSDPLNIYVGNPALKPAYSHRGVLNFTTFDPGRFINFFAFLTTTYATNAITNSQTVNDSLVRVTQPVNVKDNLNVSANVNVGFPIKKLNSRVNVGPTASASRSISLLNDQENTTRQQTVGGTVRYNFSYKDFITVDLSANLSHQQTHYEFDTQQDQVFFNKTYRAETNLNFLKNYAFNAGFDYLIYDSKTSNYSQTIPLLNLSMSRFILKNKSGEIKLALINAFDKSLGVTQSATSNYYQQETINNLGRYFMLSFTYALNKQLNPMGGGRPGGGGMRMMIVN
ncbi:MAG: TonB-dependent receptor [Cyclobacteriaceae bacterium]|nr:TonB-dependent receptor [Cyclobacteriaceae bacterium]